MKLVQKLPDVAIALEQFMDDPDTSFSLMFVEKLGEEDVVAIREGGHICDRMVVQTLSLPSKAEIKVLTGLGVDVCYTPQSDTWLCHLESTVKAAHATWLLHGVLAVLPTMVVVNTKQFAKLRCLKNILQTFGPLFALREV